MSEVKTIKLTVRNVFKTVGEHSSVSVSADVFNAVRGIRPALPYTAQGDQSGNGVRIFKLDGIKAGKEIPLYVRYDKVSRLTTFVMNAKDAEANLITLEAERANEPKLPFNSGEFARETVTAEPVQA